MYRVTFCLLNIFLVHVFLLKYFFYNVKIKCSIIINYFVSNYINNNCIIDIVMLISGVG